MSTARRTAGQVASPGPSAPRVREQARDALVLMAFSALASTALAGAILLVVSIGH